MLFFVLYMVVILFIGTRMRALGNVMHECCHGIFVSTKRGNKFFGHLIAIFLFDCFDKYTQEHIKHHRFLGHDLKDPDYLKYKEVKLNLFKNNLGNVFLSILNPWSWYLSMKAMVILRAKNKPVRVFKLLYLMLLIGGIYFWPKPIFLYFVIPYITSYQILKLFSDIMDHDGVYENLNKNDRAHNHMFKWAILNWIVFPRNDVYHLLHHLYPKLPISQYKIWHDHLLQKNSAYAAKNHSCDLQKISCSGIQD